MQSFASQVLVSDLDGTLLDRQEKITPGTIAAIRRFQAAGGLFTLATGRRPASMRRFLAEISLDLPAICFNGACICSPDGHEVLWETKLDPGAARALDWVLATRPDSGITVVQADSLHCVRMDPEAEQLLIDEKQSLGETDPRAIPFPWSKILFTQTPERTRELRRAFLDSEFAARYQLVQTSDCYFELLPGGTSKGQALKRLCAMGGLEISRCITVGDNENDAEMLALAGLGVAVANATDKAKAAARHHTVGHDQEAIRRVIEDLESGKLSLEA